MCYDTGPLTYHAKRVGLSRPPSGKWHCPKCMRSTQNLAAAYDAMYDDDILHRSFDRSNASKPETDRKVIRALQAAPTTDGDNTSRGRVRKSRGRATSATTDDDAVVRTPVKRRRARRPTKNSRTSLPPDRVRQSRRPNRAPIPIQRRPRPLVSWHCDQGSRRSGAVHGYVG